LQWANHRWLDSRSPAIAGPAALIHRAHLETSEIQSRDNLLPADSEDQVEEGSAEVRVEVQAEVREYSCSVAEADAGEVLRAARKALTRCGERND
jgi:hypothetical protein